MTKNEYIEILLKNIEIACSIRNVPSTKLGTLSETGKDVLGNLRKGSIISADKIAKIADYLKVSVDYLLGRTDNPQSYTDSVPAISGAGNTLNKRDIELLQKINSMSLDDYTDTMNYINKKINKEV